MRTWNWLLIILAAFLLGGAVGYQFNNALVARRARLFAASTPAERAAHMAGRMAKRLDLTPEQLEAVTAVILSYDARFAQNREERNAARDAISADLNRDLEALLTPGQIVLHEKIIAELRAAKPPLPRH